MAQIVLSTVIMAVVSFVACGYVKVSVTRDFALLANGDSTRTRTIGRIHDNDGHSLIGGLQIVSSPLEHVAWERIKDNVFRAPDAATLLAICIGVGAQIAFALFIGLVQMGNFYTIQGARPVILYVSIVFLALCGFLNGFATSRTLKFFKIHEWKYAAMVASLIFPVFILFTISFADIIEQAMRTSVAVPYSDGLWHYLLWWALDAPCAVFGAYQGYL